AAALAVAGPVTDDQVTLTNHQWSFSVRQLRQQLSMEQLLVVNDFAAVATAVPHLERGACQQVGGGNAVAGAPIGVLGPGSGLGVGALVPLAGGWRAVSGEGGHTTMAPITTRESDVLACLRRRHGHVSAERVLSGPGLVNLYGALAEIDGVAAAAYASAEI